MPEELVDGTVVAVFKDGPELAEQHIGCLIDQAQIPHKINTKGAWNETA